MDLRSITERVDRLESDPEPSDLRQSLSTLRDSANPTDVVLVERHPEVRHAQAALGKLERHLSRSLPLRPASERVLGILEQLVDEMRAVPVPVGKEHRSVPANVRFVSALVVPAYRVVVAGHS